MGFTGIACDFMEMEWDILTNYSIWVCLTMDYTHKTTVLIGKVVKNLGIRGYPIFTHTHTLTHSLTHSHTHSLTHSHPHTHTQTPAHTHTNTHC